jgi:hypothetical protein
MEKKRVKQIIEDISKFTYEKSDKYISVTEWANGDGVDIDYDGKLIQLSYDILDGINYLVKVLRYENFD